MGAVPESVKIREHGDRRVSRSDGYTEIRIHGFTERGIYGITDIRIDGGAGVKASAFLLF